MPLQLRLGLYVAAGLLLLLGLFGLLGTVIASRSASQMKAERLGVAQLTVAFLDHEFEEQFTELHETADELSELSEKGALEPAGIRSTIGSTEPFVTSTVFADTSGRIIAGSGQASIYFGENVSDRSYFTQPLLTKSRFASPMQTAPAAAFPFPVLSYPVRNQSGVIIGVVAASLNPNHTMLDAINSAAHQLGEAGHAELVDQNLQIIRSSEAGQMPRSAEHPTFYRPLFAAHSSHVGLTDPIGDEDPQDRGQRHVMAFVPLESVPWGLAVGGSESAFTALANRWRNDTLGLGLVALVIALFLVWITRRTVVAPVRELTAVSERISGGDLATPVPQLGAGEVRGLAVALNDMRANLEHARDALAFESSRYQGIIDSMADGVVTTDSNCRITALNPAAERLTGWSARELINQPYCDLLHGRGNHDSACAALNNASAVPDGPSVITREVIRRRWGQVAVVATARSPIHGHGGSPKGLVYVLRDISAEVRLGELRDQLVSIVSHELRSPIGHIKGYASTLLLELDGEIDPGLLRRCIETIVDASDELQKLVNDLLDLSQIAAGVLDVQREPVALKSIVRAAFDHVGTPTSVHRLRSRVPARLPRVSVDQHRIEQVLVNLVDNAIKYSPAGGDVVVAAREEGSQVIVSVTDAGIGIPADEVTAVFERFHRGTRARQARIAGTGLGLAICQGIVEAHGGRIWVTSPATTDPGQSPGTTVSFSLPVAARRGQAASHHPSGDGPVGLSAHV